MDSQANSLINPDARTGLASPVPGATAAAALPGAGGAGADFGFGGFAERIPGISRMKGNPKLPFVIAGCLQYKSHRYRPRGVYAGAEALPRIDFLRSAPMA